MSEGYIDTIFANSGDVAEVPDDIQPDGSVSFEQGYGTNYSLNPNTDPSALRVERTKWNFLMKLFSTILQQYQQHGTPDFITTAQNNGTPYVYSIYDRVRFEDVVYQSLEDDNEDEPPSDKWAIVTPGGDRRALTANTTYYIATTGNDSTGDGTVGLPWATIQHAVDYLAASVDFAGFDVTISVGNGTYTASATFNQSFTGGGSLAITGNTGTPASCVISTTNANCFTFSTQVGIPVTIDGFKLQTTTSGNCITCGSSAVAVGIHMNFGACANAHMDAEAEGIIAHSGGYTISGGGNAHWYAEKGTVQIAVTTANTITVSGTPAFTNFARSGDAGLVFVGNDITFTGSATGSRYIATGNGVINTDGSGGSYLPGDAGGSTSSGGQYL